MTTTVTDAPTRMEKDSMGEMPVPADALYGASTARAVDNFPIANEPLSPAMISAFGHLKAACAQANLDLSKLDAKLAQVIIAASDEVADNKWDDHFPVDIYQTGSGTSTNMNSNEVIASLANDKLGLGRSVKAEGGVHPNDHVNMGQSSNDTFPAAMHIAGALSIQNQLLPALKNLKAALDDKAKTWDKVLKTGRTHLMDATPIRMGQVFSGYAAQVGWSIDRAEWALKEMLVNVPIGGTAVGTGINTHPDFAGKVCATLSKRAGVTFQEAENHPEAQAAKDSFVSAHGHLKTIATSFTKIANDIRWLGSGPRCGIGELQLPAIQPGSSIMPGKVNPVICESMIQVACRVMGNDATVTASGLGGIGSVFELNVAMPVMIEAFLESVKLLANVSNVFVDKLLQDLIVNEERCTELLEASLMTITALAPEVGYDKCAGLAKQAHNENKTIKELVSELKLMPEDRLAELMNYDAMTRPS
ncbi:class II fumarate hydratase [Mucisphaera calidilacus]|uniref:Fumarate hydratase class II n=1 Tax=Mucisphaera calidilacus TaxID=2527982 RepID=A0A518BVI1_9BACT|nr:class II fumarate hydratase [Mucisphaera calidilacus]QDU70990.1 Fumarate hydratase class II [Mucisphaera calidilacus]